MQKISIHALREEGDVRRAERAHHAGLISIHALREEGDTSTWCSSHWPADFYPRPPRGGRPTCRIRLQTRLPISIHALREEGDKILRIYVKAVSYFYPRPPRGGRPITSSTVPAVRYFYPRPPRGGRLCSLGYDQLAQIFLSTPSARRATKTEEPTMRNMAISIHALREEGDRVPWR